MGITSSQAMLTLLFSPLILLPLSSILESLTLKIPSSFIVSIVLNFFTSRLSLAAALATHYTTVSHRQCAHKHIILIYKPHHILEHLIPCPLTSVVRFTIQRLHFWAITLKVDLPAPPEAMMSTWSGLHTRRWNQGWHSCYCCCWVSRRERSGGKQKRSLSSAIMLRCLVGGFFQHCGFDLPTIRLWGDWVEERGI